MAHAVDSPRIGPPIDDGVATIVVFADPSCPTCAQFYDDGYQKLYDRAVSPGRVSYLWRGLPSVEPWGRPATRALFALHDLDASGFWLLKARYYTQQSSIRAGNLNRVTKRFLSETDLDVDTEFVVSAMEDEPESVAARIKHDEDAAEASNIEAIPSFVLFREGRYVTTVVGNQPYEVFEGALEL